MDKAIENMRGYAIVSVTGGEPEQFLNHCRAQGVLVRSCKTVSEIELKLRLRKQDISRARHCASRSNCELKELQTLGAGYVWSRVKKRYFLIFGMLLGIVLLCISNLYIWDIEIVGNETVPEHEILNALEGCGVYIGASWTDFTADQIRSKLLYELPELSFLTVNVNGSRATVLVRERIAVPEIDYDSEFSDIVALKSAVVESVYAYRGTALVQSGSVVHSGDILISGYMPEFAEDATVGTTVSALGEVWAQTSYEFTVSESLTCYEKQYTGRESRNFAIIFGENRLNFYSRTGIYRANCDTIYNEWNLGIENLLSLPISLVCETRTEYETIQAVQNQDELMQRLESLLYARLLREIGDTGEIIAYNTNASADGDELILTLKATCREQIGIKIG